MYLALWLIRRWRLPATPCLILPVAVSLKRFLTPLLVLSLGIFVSFVPLALARDDVYPTATACLRAGPLVFPTIWKARAYTGSGARRQPPTRESPIRRGGGTCRYRRSSGDRSARASR